MEGAGPPGSPSSAFLSADLGDLFNFWKLLISFFLFFFFNIFGCTGSPLPRTGFLSLRRERAALGRAHRLPAAVRGSSCCRHRLQAHRPQWLQRAGLIALRHAGSNPDPSHLQADSFSLYIREAPTSYCFLIRKRAITLSTPHSTVVVENPS